MDENELKELLATVRNLKDLEEIRSLRNRYHHFINESKFDRFGELYTEDAVVQLDYLSTWTGIEEINAGFMGIPSRVSLIKQFVHSHEVTVNGDSASGYAYLEARYAREGQSLMVAGRYDDAYKRTDRGWRITNTYFELFFSVPVQIGWAGETLNYLKPEDGR